MAASKIRVNTPVNHATNMYKAKPIIFHCGRSMDLFLGPRKPRGVPLHASFFQLDSS
jgi:hypothetical protein